MASSPFLSAAFMVVDSYFIDESGIIEDLPDFQYPEISQADALTLAIGAFVIEHSSSYDLMTKDVI